MDNFIVIRPEQLKNITLVLLCLATVTGFAAGWLGIGLATGSAVTGAIPWIELAVGMLLVVCWWVFAAVYHRTYKNWQQETSNLVEEQASLVDQGVVKLKDHEIKQTQTFAACRHQKLTFTLKELHSLMTSHLQSVTQETNEAALNLINQLTLIHDAMSHLLQTVNTNQKESDQIASGSQTTLETNQQTMDLLQKYIERRLAEIDHDHQMAHELQEQAAVMSDLTKLIESVAKQTTIVATNAKIEATRAGVYGQAFGVIADEVTKLSAQIGKSSKQIIQSINQMGKSIEVKFKAKLDKHTKAEETNLLNGLENQLVKMGKSYLRLEGFNRETLQNINSSSEEIKSKVNGSLMAIQFQDITQQQIEVILKSLNLFEQYLSDQSCFDLAGEKGRDFEEFNIDRIRGLYVMKKQHDIHNRHFQARKLVGSKKNETETGEITLF
jgi:methyl-accepting chemotaxis protein